MAFLEYANKTHSNIIPQNEFEELVQEVFNTISINLSKSLGPLGSSATILDGMLTEATKDGYSILQKYRFHNRYKKMVYNLIMAPCRKMNNVVGDGTTTAIALTSELFKVYNYNKPTFQVICRMPRQFTKTWDKVIDDISYKLTQYTTAIDPEDYDTIYNIAYVTSNGDDEVSKAIAKVYHEAKTPSIKQKDSPTNESYIEAIDGFDFPTNMITDAYVRNQDLTSSEDDVRILIFDHKIETDVFKSLIVPINEVFKAMGNKLIVVAPYYDSLMCSTVVEQYIKKEFREANGINLILTQDNPGKLSEHEVEDFSAVVDAKVITEDMVLDILNAVNEKGSIDKFVDETLTNADYTYYGLFGMADHVSLSCNNGSVFRVSDKVFESERYQEALRRATNELNDIKANTSAEKGAYSAKIYNANARILQLQMKNYIYYIGANSDLQKQILWDSVEDVIKCVKSATRFGVVPGCQLSIIRACNELLSEYDDTDAANLTNDDKLRYTIINMIYNAVVGVYLKVINGPDGTGIIKTLPRWEYTPNTEEAIANLRKEASEKSANIIKESIEKNQVFDMEHLDYSEFIITSAQTDMMVLQVASELIKILISGNQCVACDSDVDASHEEDREVYV